MKTIISLMLLISFNTYSMTFKECQIIYNRIIIKNNIKYPPRLFIIPSNLITAGYFPTGNFIGVTKGLLKTVTKDEMAFVLSHELQHWKGDRYLSQRKNEIQADKIGVYISNKAGYNGCAGAKIINIFPEDKNHDSGIKRYRQLRCK